MPDFRDHLSEAQLRLIEDGERIDKAERAKADRARELEESEGYRQPPAHGPRVVDHLSIINGQPIGAMSPDETIAQAAAWDDIGVARVTAAEQRQAAEWGQDPGPDWTHPSRLELEKAHAAEAKALAETPATKADIAELRQGITKAKAWVSAKVHGG